MARDYTYNELMQMQEQALERAREMQTRSAYEPEEETPSQQTRSEREPAHFSPEHCSCPSCAGKQSKQNLFGNLFNMDDDKMLIFALILILSKNCKDEILIFALLYIIL